MPTANRAEWAAGAVESFLAQDYPNKELVIFDSGDNDDLSDLLYSNELFELPNLKYYVVRSIGGSPSLGQIRNSVNNASKGELICHWDDDDWYAPNRISLQVEAIQESGADIVGLHHLLFYDPEKDQSWFYTYPQPQRPWLAGGTCLYRRELWESFPFPDVQVGSDTLWLWSFPPTRDGQRRMVAMRDDFYVARIHDGNTSKKVIQEREWKPFTRDFPEWWYGQQRREAVSIPLQSPATL